LPDSSAFRSKFKSAEIVLELLLFDPDVVKLPKLPDWLPDDESVGLLYDL